MKKKNEKEHPCSQYENFNVISSGFRNNTNQKPYRLTLVDLP